MSKSSSNRRNNPNLLYMLTGSTAKADRLATTDDNGTTRAHMNARLMVNGCTAEPLVDSGEVNNLKPNGQVNEKVRVLFVGCNRDEHFQEMIKRGDSERNRDSFEYGYVSTFDELVGMLSKQKIHVVVLGTEINGSNWDGASQLSVLEYIKKQSSETRVIYITEEVNPTCTLIIAKGADDIVSRDYLQPKDLVARIENVLRLHRSRRGPEQQPLICEVSREHALMVDDFRMERVRETMDMMAKKFDLHQRETLHYPVMNVIYCSLARFFGQQILDVGCGTGHPMRRFIRDKLVPDFSATPKARGPTKVLGIDIRPSMLSQARAGAQRLFQQHGDILKGNLEMYFLEKDLYELNRELLAELGFGALDTILASYFIHWANDKRGAVKVFSELLPPGGKLITVEEWPLVVTPNPHFTPEEAAQIKRDALPIERKLYYEMLRQHGFSNVRGGTVVHKIDGHHRMFGTVFVKK